MTQINNTRIQPLYSTYAKVAAQAAPTGGGAGVTLPKDSLNVTGGAGADVFHSFGDAGIDRVTDFNAAEGDRVMLDPGTAYTVSQVGADTVIAMTGGGQMVLVGVPLSSLPTGWIFGA